MVAYFETNDLPNFFLKFKEQSNVCILHLKTYNKINYVIQLK